MKVILAPRATRDWRAIAAYIRNENPSAAQAMLSLIFASIEKLSEHPRMGRRLNAAGAGRMPISRTPYIAFYRIAGKEVPILHARDGRRKPFRT
jgi:addiction module RelE/StbE family toxin